MTLNWKKSPDGLLPAIIQDAKTLQVLMLGYMNEESLKLTIETKRVTFFSRSRQSIWLKGETSGNFFNVVDINPDCDQDAILITVDPIGPACHRETETCFDHNFEMLNVLENTIRERFENKPQSNSTAKPSYTQTLINEGLDRVIQKVGEEGVETVIAAKNNDLPSLEGEAADLIFHLMVLLQFKKTSLTQVMKTLQKRHNR
jgi:phosphoribosyl-ATP pyrophosphohydrolase/phosphoribosyl-AMP cyclohydrolase